MARPKRELQRVALQLPPSIVAEIDEYAEFMGLSRTTAIHILCSDSLAVFKQEQKKKESDD